MATDQLLAPFFVHLFSVHRCKHEPSRPGLVSLCFQGFATRFTESSWPRICHGPEGLITSILFSRS